MVSEGDILLMKDGAAMGKLAFVDALSGKACLNSHLLLFRPFVVNGQKSYHPKFLFYFMLTQSFQTYVQVNGIGSTFPGVSQEALGNFKICLPPIEEQMAIVRVLDIETARQNEAAQLEEKQIQLIRDYRERLIADVVTGKIDVSWPDVVS
jgi:type I restriction enzyme, S subunit